jgi:hypothetical protein
MKELEQLGEFAIGLGVILGVLVIFKVFTWAWGKLED